MAGRSAEAEAMALTVRRSPLRLAAIALAWLAAGLAGWHFAVLVRSAAVRPSPCFVTHYALARMLLDGENLAGSYDEHAFAAKVSLITPWITDINVNPPTTALLLLPFAGLDHADARVVWTVLSLLLLAATVALWLRAADLRGAWAAGFVALTFLFQPLAANFHMANVYVLLLGLAAVAWHGHRTGNDAALGVALGLMLVIKLAGGLLWLLLLVERRWRALAWAGGTAALAVLGSLPWIGLAAWRADAAILAGVAERPERSVTAYQTVLGFFRHLGSPDPTWNASPLLAAPHVVPWVASGVSFGLVVALVLAARRKPGDDAVFAASLVVSVVLSPLSLDYTYTLLLLPIAAALAQGREARSPWRWAALAVAIFAIAANLPYRSPRLASGAWAILAYPKLYGALLLAGVLLVAAWRSAGRESVPPRASDTQARLSLHAASGPVVAPPELAVVVPAVDEGDNLARLLPALAEVLAELDVPAEVVVVDGGSRDDTADVAARYGARVVQQRERGYGGALAAGFAATAARHVVTMDADLSHRPAFLADLWRRRGDADVLIASRYVARGGAHMGWVRGLASCALNRAFAHVLGLPQRDLSSGFRMYRREVLDHVVFTARDFDALEEILIRAVNSGFRVVEVPFVYLPRRHGHSHVRPLRFAWAFASTLLRLWRMRNSSAAPDYDWRAFDSPVWLQRTWQRVRHRVVLGFVTDRSSVLDVGCGSSRIIADLPAGVGLDLAHAKLRWLRPHHGRLVQGTALALPCRTAAFRTVICSELIEHLPDAPALWGELDRVLAPGGALVLGTPDYGRPLWRVIEWIYGLLLPDAYAREHVTRYTRRTLAQRLRALGYEIERVRYVCGCEIVFKARKPAEQVRAGIAGEGTPARG